MVISFETKSHMKHESLGLNNQIFSENMQNDFLYVEKTKKVVD